MRRRLSTIVATWNTSKSITIRALMLATMLAFGNVAADACPFCPAVEPTLAQRRDEATACYLGEAETTDPKEAVVRFRVHQTLKGMKSFTNEVAVSTCAKFDRGALAILIANPGDGTMDWTAEPIDEAIAGYFAKLPGEDRPARERLAFFAARLEHENSTIAADVMREFARADFADVRAVAPRIGRAKLRGWLDDASTCADRRGFYGMLLGLSILDAAAAEMKPSATDLAADRAWLAEAAFTPASDFRAGYDGVLAGYLLANGAEGLKTLEAKLLDRPAAAVGDLKHAVTALRFVQDEGPRALRGAVETAYAKLLDRPETAAAVITDLARWGVGERVTEVVAWYDRQDGDATIRRAVVGYLRRIKSPQAGEALDALRRRDPDGVATAEAALNALYGDPSR
ncbi:MAG: hypothetical protein QM811_13830 [Pirellulales bacterium]